MKKIKHEDERRRDGEVRTSIKTLRHPHKVHCSVSPTSHCWRWAYHRVVRQVENFCRLLRLESSTFRSCRRQTGLAIRIIFYALSEVDSEVWRGSWFQKRIKNWRRRTEHHWVLRKRAIKEAWCRVALMGASMKPESRENPSRILDAGTPWWGAPLENELEPVRSGVGADVAFTGELEAGIGWCSHLPSQKEGYAHCKPAKKKILKK